MTNDVKAQYSHRGRALRELKSEFDKVLKWIAIHMPPKEDNICMGARHD
jgi:XTP/dITP diphosphohydrolase